MENKSNHLVGSVICGLLTAFGIVATVLSLIGGSNNGLYFLVDCIDIPLLILIVYYAFAGYKKPHGNLLKCIILIRLISFLVGVYANCHTGHTVNVVFGAIEIGLVCYVAGRLDKIKENLFLMIIATVIEVVYFVSGIVLNAVTIGTIAPFVIWLDICVAYFLRYKEHKEAGLMDAPKA